MITAKDDLLAWVRGHAHDEADVKLASRLIARYCAESVRSDRLKWDGPKEPSTFGELLGAIIGVRR